MVVVDLMLEIPCRAIGTPQPTITWEKDGFQVSFKKSSFLSLPPHSLLIFITSSFTLLFAFFNFVKLKETS